MAKAKTAPAPKGHEIEIFDEVEQGSDAWFELRMGVPTCSEFGTIMASGKDGGGSKTRRTLMNKLAGERITGIPAENFKNAAMDRGNAMEQEAREHYARTRFVELRRVAFVRRGKFGGSPDSLIAEDGGLEVKTEAPHLFIERLQKPKQLPSEHRAQVQGLMMVTGRKWWDLSVYYTAMPEYVVREERNESYIDEMVSALEVFELELRRLVDKIKGMR